MSRADGTHSGTCTHISVPCSRLYCQDCTCDAEAKADYERDVAAAEVEMMRLISRSISDGHRGNGSAEDDVCCQVCQEIKCDPDCAVAEARAREAAAEARGFARAVRQLAGEGCTWADGDCPNGPDCLSCKSLDALIAERERGDVQGWNAALKAVQERLLEPPASAGRGRQGSPGKYEIAGTIAALRKNTGPEVGG